MTQEEIDKMIEDWVENGFPSELKRLIPAEETEPMYECIPIDIKDTEVGIFNPIAEIGRLGYDKAKKVMLEVYDHDLSVDEYPLLLTSGSPLDFFEAVFLKRYEEGEYGNRNL
ncbi:hypothetical protein RMP67_00090 [Streptococcus suis]|uniref:hypothetical protein n=1 Tax=Streptococcus suis TaxID=1307 RepID=UPI0028C4DC33|nr:hypothetical protein [Streptococcus suis]WNO79670.1 hypothetical protein RMP67_06635 [Streptococcus suis]WNO79673.1 hypothetical protein RMP67_00090 [Streptococcus suis]